MAGAEIENILAPVPCHHIVYGGHMAPCKIYNMDIVSYARTVRSVVVIAEDVQMVTSADSDLGDEGHQIVRDPARVLSDQPAAVRTYRIEVSQK